MTQLPSDPLRLQAVLEAACLALQGIVCCRCRDVCPRDAVSLVALCGGYARPSIDPEKCACCGRCLAVCPGLGAAAPG